jgi:transcriptional regulator with XRE-family HTH domain
MAKERDPVCVRFGENLRRLRSLAGLSQDDLGKLLGVTFQQVQKYEKGVNNVNVITLSRLKTILGCSFADFFAGLDGDGADGKADAGGYRCREAYRLSQAVMEIRDPKVRESLIRHAQLLAGRRLR